jgi:DNA-directed RNA polymerase sigma subunit (sigma70/sigma32)
MAELRRRSRERQYRREQDDLAPRRRALLELRPEAWLSVRGRDRTIVQMYYGLADQKPRSQHLVAEALSLHQALVNRVIRTVTARLLGWRVLDPAGRLQVECTICGAAVDRLRPQTGRAYTCTPECKAEFSRRTASSMQARRHASAVEKLREKLDAFPVGVFDLLTGRDQAILRGYSGMGGDSPKTAKLLAEEFGIAPTSINRIVREAVHELEVSCGQPAER